MLTDDMTRLCREIVDLRGMRASARRKISWAGHDVGK